MKINEIIKNKRKEQNLTQEQIAQYLGVSTPAVSKWENGNSYPDITILPALARLLKIDLNTLLSFNEELSEKEIGNLSNEIVSIIQDKGYDMGFQKAMDKIQEYPNCDLLISMLALALEGALFMHPVENKEEYQVQIEKLYERILNCKNVELHNHTASMLISKYIERDEYEKAQSLLDSLPNAPFDKKQMQSNLYMKQGRISEAAELLEQKLLNASNEIQSALLGMLNIALKENNNIAAEYFADISCKSARLYDAWEYSSYIAHFQLAVVQKDIDSTISILKPMLAALCQNWDIGKSPLYKHLKISAKKSNFQEDFLLSIIFALENSEELDFLRSNTEFLEIIKLYKNK